MAKVNVSILVSDIALFNKLGEMVIIGLGIEGNQWNDSTIHLPVV